MREIVLDTETTGFDPFSGDRIVEIGAVELVGHMPTGNHYHQYINPQRDMPTEAFEVHGISEEFLADKPLFAAIAQDFLDFIGDAKLVIHNAAFDMKFLNAELKWVNKPLISDDRAIDTVAMARRKFPGSPASLDALCRRFGITTERELHGALLDSQILADVYLELIGGRQPGLVLSEARTQTNTTTVDTNWRPSPRPQPLPPRLTESETATHQAFVEKLGDAAVWKRFES
ncbi:DNA polymerase III subunit epsilon [Vannielia litorea]|uniref:DNA polymerase III subunit epsilon n=1 Tax=Vannielia litorea TaxID=1217970 RepID=UPI001C9675D3|nr:DNA polymerase III subunit epsilon [Vannielia litorea]MBY6154960.1 DNA polymerase III subunit epsilon [Vannielia litorea]